jgi:uncharacterized protein YeeX (DUF496 family)
MRQQKDVTRGFKGIWIPKEIWFASDLTYAEVILLSEINSLDLDDKGCIASNGYLAKFMGVSERTLRDHITNLKEKNYVYQASFNGRVRGLKVNFPTGREEENPPCSMEGDSPVREEVGCKSSIRENKVYIKDKKASSQSSDDPSVSEHIKNLKQDYYERYPDHFVTNADWAREYPAIKKLAQFIVKKAPGNFEKQERLIGKVINAFERLCNPKGKHFLSGTPPIPSKMMAKGIWPYVIESISEYEETT